MKGDGVIKFGDYCIIHPKATIIVEEGCSIEFGDYNIIEENVLIKAVPKYNSVLNNMSPVEIVIGNYNHIKVGARLENTNILDHNIIDFYVEAEDCSIESNTSITATVKLPKRANIKTGSVVINNKIMLNNASFKESEYKKNMIELSNLLFNMFSNNFKKRQLTSSG
eukprot:CAMPEP_0170518336 /NCGR_PEP_ID=MMETSP0209-20121228/4049_1 /TAXON_ID=665100 ORGANISM="Litonotus pictus, Strain P1" /NCGR_SAMPLE_ID=MMETSP0209 /ASSEMBLY_ACC=CAM_ASM_000301 /LENGTH=166 /DNA_ID=CAMNT_0010803855 /DNA_START=42 /DNA_END=542 /DNA_ORIENTATION=+